MEHSVLERGHRARTEQAYGLCMGRVTKVYAKERLAEVRTFSGAGSLNAQYIPKCQWLSFDSNPDGDEATSIPRVGSIGMVAFVDGEPYILGYFRGLRKTETSYDATNGEEPYTLSPGDKVIATKNGSRITVKANGVIEIQSKDTLKTVYFPNESQMVNLCRYFELKTDGGYIKWGPQKGIPGQTKHEAVYRTDPAGTMAVIETRGAAGGSTIFRQVIAPGLTPDVALYKQEIDLDGSTRRIIGPVLATFSEEIGPDGTTAIEATGGWTLNSKLGNIAFKADVGNIEVTATVGDITHEATAGHYQIHSLQDTAILSDTGDVDFEATAGDFKATGSQAKMVLSKGKVALGGPTGELLDVFDQFIDVVKTVFEALAQETHIGNLGYPTAPPTNAAQYVQGAALAAQLKVLLGTFKGSL